MFKSRHKQNCFDFQVVCRVADADVYAVSFLKIQKIG